MKWMISGALLLLTACSAADSYNDAMTRVNFDMYIESTLARPHTYNLITWTEADTLTVNGRLERMSYVEFEYKDEWDKIRYIETFAYFDTAGKVLRVERWPTHIN